ncbi:hypothetical protein CspeluHIS016_0309470 [Cutaneotrichosporon spelunceum]|uniref:Uncharacterized protein n=1 Tax=Cutaneotrichosporon spelunceum TaxID=1672016 RepID=A0AAD3TUF3_9TREE|nr:hypothetical protein CspeluHIS016_0309470 [Cutaneotrichosporon spelunceum]
MVSHLQVLAAHIGLDVQFTRKRSPPPAGGLPFKRSRSKTPEPHRGIIPKLSPPRTSSGKNTRRQSFAALLPGGRGAPPKRSRPGQWTLEKRLIFVDRLLTAGYKALCLTDLAEEKQLVNQLTPGRTGSIRELCMNAAARLHDHCTDCKKKQAVAKRKADRDGLADFLLRGASECVGDEEEEELNGNDSLEEDELMDEEPEKEEKNE